MTDGDNRRPIYLLGNVLQAEFAGTRLDGWVCRVKGPGVDTNDNEHDDGDNEEADRSLQEQSPVHGRRTAVLCCRPKLITAQLGGTQNAYLA